MPRKFVVMVAALTLVAGACGGSKGGDLKASASHRTTTTDALLVGDTSTTGADGTGGSTAVKSGTATTAKPGGSTTTTRKATTSTTANPNAVPAPAKPGTYDYAQSGSTSQGSPPSRGTLVVSGGGPTQVFARHVDNNSEGDLTFDFTDHGPFLTRVVLKQGGVSITCTFGAPVPAPPWPPTAGSHFSGHATCDNGFSADFSGSVGGHTTDHVAGAAYDTIVITSTLHATGNVLGHPVDVTVNDTQHWAPALRVPTYSHEVISGQVSGDVTSTLLTASPH